MKYFELNENKDKHIRIRGIQGKHYLKFIALKECNRRKVEKSMT